MNSIINPHYDFKEAYCGDFNDRAYKIAKDFCFNNASNTNPSLLITSDIGLGKSFLLQALYTQIKTESTYSCPLYISCYKLITEYYTAVRENSTNAFIKSFEKHDILLIDDIHVLQNKSKAQEFLAQLLDSVINCGHKVIMASLPQVHDFISNPKLISLIYGSIHCSIQPLDEQEIENILNYMCDRYGTKPNKQDFQELLSRTNNELRSVLGYFSTKSSHQKFKDED